MKILPLIFVLLPLTLEAITLTFDPAPIPGGARLTRSYAEGDFRVMGEFGHGSSQNRQRASNQSSGYVEIISGSSALFTHKDGVLFDANAVDLSEYSIVFPFPATITFLATYPTGSQTAHTFITDGAFDSIGGIPDFETFTFPSTFRGLSSLYTDTNPFSLDNLRLSVVPEPGTGLLSFVAVCFPCFFRRAISRG